MMAVMTSYRYGQPPRAVTEIALPDWQEFMHYLYLPVVMRGFTGARIPRRLHFMSPLVEMVCAEEHVSLARPERYVYLTMRRGFATPGNPLNRPGWHADGFGSDDVNYIWSDRWPTRFAVGRFTAISDDHVRSAEQFEEQVAVATGAMDPGDARGPWPNGIEIVDGEPCMLYRLDPSMVHATPLISPPGGMRSFFKVSVSPDKYNLLGNSHNFLFGYEWKMWSREEVRNHPSYAGGDAGPQA